MPDHDDRDLTRRLDVLFDAPVPVMPGAAAARARGSQRTRRTRAALVAATAVATVLAVVAGVSLTGGGADRETLPPASPPASPAPSAAPRTDPSGPAAAALLREEDAESALGGDWQEAADGPALLPASCPEGGFDEVQPVNAAERRMQSPDALALTQLVRLYADDDTARRAWGALVDDVQACPRVEVVGGLPGSGPTQAYVRQTTSSTPRTSAAAFVVLIEGGLVSVVQLAGSTADVEALPPLADLARERARAALPPEPGERLDPPPPAPEPDAPFAPSEAFLSPEQAAAAESPGWAVDEAYEPAPGPLLDPCGDGAAPLAGEVTASAERAMGSRRDVGGSSLQQEVYVYGSTQAARDAVAAYAAAVERCPSAASPTSPPGHTVRSSLVVSGSSRLLVRRQGCAPTCTDLATTYALVAQAGRGVTVAAYGIGEDGDPAQAARALLDAVSAQLARAAD